MDQTGFVNIYLIQPMQIKTLRFLIKMFVLFMRDWGTNCPLYYPIAKIFSLN